MMSEIKKVYAIVAYDLYEYIPSMYVYEVYSSREAAEKNMIDDDEGYSYEIKEWDVLDE